MARKIIIYKDILFSTAKSISRLLRIVTTIDTFATFKHVHLFRTRIECYLDVRHLLVSNATPPPQLREHWPSSDHGPQSPLSELLLSRYTWYSGINPELLNVVFHCCRLCRPCRRRCWKLQLINARNLQNKNLSFFKTRYFYNPLRLIDTYANTSIVLKITINARCLQNFYLIKTTTTRWLIYTDMDVSSIGRITIVLVDRRLKWHSVVFYKYVRVSTF